MGFIREEDNMKKAIAMFAFAMALFSAPAAAQQAGKKIFINDIDLAAYLITDVELKCVNVKFDSKGNLYIIAPGYSFEALGGSKEPAKGPAVEQDRATHFYLVTFPKPDRSDTGYDIDVHVNGKFVRRVLGGKEQEIVDITSYFRQGANEVSFLSVRRKGFKPPKGAPPSLRIAIARGYEAKGTYVLKDILWEVTRTATESKSNFVDKQTIEVQSR